MALPESLRRELAHMTFLIEQSCVIQATDVAVDWANRIANLTAEVERLHITPQDMAETQPPRTPEYR